MGYVPSLMRSLSEVMGELLMLDTAGHCDIVLIKTRRLGYNEAGLNSSSNPIFWAIIMLDKEICSLHCNPLQFTCCSLLESYFYGTLSHSPSNVTCSNMKQIGYPIFKGQFLDPGWQLWGQVYPSGHDVAVLHLASLNMGLISRPETHRRPMVLI